MLTKVIVPDIEEYRTIAESAADPRVPYGQYWIRRLVQAGKVEAKKFGTGARSVWLVHMPSLLAYVREMEALGNKKHAG